MRKILNSLLLIIVALFSASLMSNNSKIIYTSDEVRDTGSNGRG